MLEVKEYRNTVLHAKILSGFGSWFRFITYLKPPGDPYENYYSDEEYNVFAGWSLLLGSLEIRWHVTNEEEAKVD